MRNCWGKYLMGSGKAERIEVIFMRDRKRLPTQDELDAALKSTHPWKNVTAEEIIQSFTDGTHASRGSCAKTQ